ncbi:hypothetical protein [uncultured Croceitalea sp.]|uniref:hypothetical protein n=1 Tax=uncultured Croceitalea sp. TaxID=1798908 RepID=UPI0033060BBF
MLTEKVHPFISIAFLAALAIAIFMIARLAKKANQSKVYAYILGFYCIYLIIVAILCFQGMLDAVTLPPRIIVITTLPLLLFYVTIISNTRFYKTILKEVHVADWVQLHIFRLIGGVFLLLYFLNLLPKTFALIAGIGDVVTAVSSLFVAQLIRKRHKYAKKIALFWNTFGLLDILATSTTAVLLTKVSIETGSMGVDILTEFPFCFIPAFAPATIIFLHISIYRKLFSEKI